jgi:hypothetical protein
MSGDEALRVAGYNVVIHEFAHKLDMRHGEPNGFPPLHPDMNPRDWKRVFAFAYDDFCRKVDDADLRAEDDDGEALAALPIDAVRCDERGGVLRSDFGGFLRNAGAARALLPGGLRAASVVLQAGSAGAAYCVPSGTVEGVVAAALGALRPSRSASSISFSSAADFGAASRASRSMSCSCTCFFIPSLYWRVAA